jgi:hypothetical protein
MFEKQKAFFHGLRELSRNPYLLEQQNKKLEYLGQDLENAERKVKLNFSSATQNDNLLHHAQEAILERLNALTHAAMELLSAEKVYELLKPWDKEQFSLYFAAKEILGIDLSDYFHTEDAMGYFEDADGAKLLKYAEIARFADKEWRPLNSPGTYEVLDSYELHTDTPAYQQYRERLWPLAVQKTVERFKRALLDENGMDKVFQAMDTLTGVIREEPEEVEETQLQKLFQEASLYCDPRKVYQAIQPMDPQGEVLFRCAENQLGDEAVTALCKQAVNSCIRGEPGFTKTPQSMKAAQDGVNRLLEPVETQQQPHVTALSPQTEVRGVIHFNLAMTVSGGKEVCDLTVFCNNKRYIILDMTEERGKAEVTKILRFANVNGYSVKEHTGWGLSLYEVNSGKIMGDPQEHKIVGAIVEAAKQRENNFLRAFGVTYTVQHYDEYDGPSGPLYEIANIETQAHSIYAGYLRVGDSNDGMRAKLQKAGLEDVEIDAVRDYCGGPISDLIAESDLYYRTADICTLISRTVTEEAMPQIQQAAVQQEAAEMEL